MGPQSCPNNPLKVLVSPTESQFCHRSPHRVLVLPLGFSGESRDLRETPVLLHRLSKDPGPTPGPRMGPQSCPRVSWFCSWDPHGTPNLPMGPSAGPHLPQRTLKTLLLILRTEDPSAGCWTSSGTQSCSKDLSGTEILSLWFPQDPNLPTTLVLPQRPSETLQTQPMGPWTCSEHPQKVLILPQRILNDPDCLLRTLLRLWSRPRVPSGIPIMSQQPSQDPLDPLRTSLLL